MKINFSKNNKIGFLLITTLFGCASLKGMEEKLVECEEPKIVNNFLLKNDSEKPLWYLLYQGQLYPPEIMNEMIKLHLLEPGQSIEKTVDICMPTNLMVTKHANPSYVTVLTVGLTGYSSPVTQRKVSDYKRIHLSYVKNGNQNPMIQPKLDSQNTQKSSNKLKKSTKKEKNKVLNQNSSASQALVGSLPNVSSQDIIETSIAVEFIANSASAILVRPQKTKILSSDKLFP